MGYIHLIGGGGNLKKKEEKEEDEIYEYEYTVETTTPHRDL